MQEEKPGKLADRTVDYGLAVIDFCEMLPRNAAGRHIGDQLLRSATSVGANYAEATEAESTADFIHKLRIAMKEPKESRVWLLFASRIKSCEQVGLRYSLGCQRTCSSTKPTPTSKKKAGSHYT